MSEAAPFPTTAVSTELPFGALRQGGRFVIRRVLGRGGFGITYAADDRRLHREVAIKELCFGGATRVGGVVVPPKHEVDAFASAKERFMREAAVLARFSHPGVVRIYEVFEEAGTAYLVMELLNGRTLHQHLVSNGGPMPEGQVLNMAARCGEALTVLHAAGVLHRDLNPSNVVLTPDGRVVLIDFGLAREFAFDSTTPMTRIVTPGYAAPEQYQHHGRCGPPTDVFGLAATLYCALTGRAPVAVSGRRAGSAYIAPRVLTPTVSKLVSDAVLDGLELEQAHRPRSVEEFLGRLGIGGPVVTTPVAPAPSYPAAPQMPLPPAPIEPVRATVAGRGKVIVPALVTAGAFGATVPVIAFAALGLLLLPGAATLGDALVFVRMRRLGDRLHWRHRAALPPYVPVRYLRNLGHVFYVGVPAWVIESATIAVALAIDAVSEASTTQEWVLRIGGALAAVVLCVPVFRDRVRFKAAVVGDRVLDRALDNGTLTSFGMSLWIAMALMCSIAVGLRPDTWPFGG